MDGAHMNKILVGVLLALFISACGERVSIEEKMCRIAVEDVFIPANELNIVSVQRRDDGNEINVLVDYSIIDAASKRTADTAICAFDKSSKPAKFKKIIQFNAEMPPQHVDFIGKRVEKILAAESEPSSKTPDMKIDAK